MTLGLPDPDRLSEFYEGVPAKRALAWVVDVCITAVLAAAFLVPIALLSIVIWPFAVLVVPVLLVTGFVYRWFTISTLSATWGMWLMAIELRDGTGRRLDPTQAFLHTLGTTLCFAGGIFQVVSAVLMLTTPRGQGLPDLFLGTTMLNRAA